MNSKTKKITLTAMFIALTVVLLFAAALIPSGRLAMVAASGLVSAVAVIECGMASGAMCFVGAVLIGALLVPVKGVVFLYFVFFGYYPLIKALAEKTDKRVMEFIIKLLAVNFALSAVLAAFHYGFAVGVDISSVAVPILYIGGNIVFVLYDIGFSGLVSLYINRIRRRR